MFYNIQRTSLEGGKSEPLGSYGADAAFPQFYKILIRYALWWIVLICISLNKTLEIRFHENEFTSSPPSQDGAWM